MDVYSKFSALVSVLHQASDIIRLYTSVLETTLQGKIERGQNKFDDIFGFY